ncbi:MAG TPA: glucokinase, partial [Spongiibacteraceae bacterium]|nr:glucokinase [Spongiibacteraceae bacterium]
MMSANTTILVGDIGGTNCRLALVRNGQLARETITTYADANYPTLTDAISAYLCTQAASISVACLAIAGPVSGDSIKLTNNAWHFSIEQTRKDLNLKALEIINDFEAVVLALPHLGGTQLEKIGGGEALAGKPKVALGPGTGYGAAKIIRCSGNYIALPSEGGHV